MVPKLDQCCAYASKAQHFLLKHFLSSRFSGRSQDSIWFDDEDETCVKSQLGILWKIFIGHFFLLIHTPDVD